MFFVPPDLHPQFHFFDSSTDKAAEVGFELPFLDNDDPLVSRLLWKTINSPLYEIPFPELRLLCDVVCAFCNDFCSFSLQPLASATFRRTIPVGHT